MKQLTCEMCGSTNLIKKDGVFVCQSCGCQYSVEEAKKMMIEGVVDVTGTVQIDNANLVEKYLANARRAKRKEDWEETEKYYNMVEQNDPSNIEAIFYSAYGKAMTGLLEEDIYKREATFKVLRNSISVIDDNYKVENSKQNREIIIGMSKDLIKMFSANFLYNTSTYKIAGVSFDVNDQDKTIRLFYELVMSFWDSMKNIENVDPMAYMFDITIEVITSFIKIWDPKQRSEMTSSLNNAVKDQESRKEKFVEKYWKDHPNEKLALENQRESLLQKIDILKNEIDELKKSSTFDLLNTRREHVMEELKNIPFWKKERKETLKELEKIDNELKSCSESQAIIDKKDEITSVENELQIILNALESPYEKE